MVIDGFGTAGNPVVITGSHNWSTAAETRNNENTIIIYDSLIANLYVQEFAERYRQASGDSLPIPVMVSVTDEDNSLPTEFTLSQNYPNPFNPVTTVIYSLSISGFVNLSIYNIRGELVSTVVNEFQKPGEYRTKWNADNVASGIYFYRLQIGSASVSKKMLLLK